MRTSRLLGASLTTVLAVGLAGAAGPPAAYAGDNDRNDWDDRRVVQTPGAQEGPVQAFGGGTDQWSLVARNIGGDTWRLRESTDGALRYTNLDDVPLTVSRWQAVTSPKGWTIGVYEDGGRLFGYTKAPEGARGPKELAAAQTGPVVVDVGSDAAAIIAAGDTWHQHLESTGTGTGATAEHFVSYPDPDVDGVPGAGGQSFGFTSTDLLAFWNEPNGDLRVARRPVTDTTAAFSAPRTIAAGERAIRFVETALGPRLVTQSTNGAVNLYSYTADAAGFSFTDRRELAGAATDAPAPTVLVDGLGTLTVGWRETGVTGGGLVLWQEDRPVSTFLERPTLVPGTRDTEARVVTSPRGSLAVALRRDDETAIVRVKHLPAGKTRWTDGIRLVSPKPITDSAAAWDIGAPTADQDLRVVVNDTVGVYGFRFDAPRPYTTMTKPVRKVQKSRTYRIGWAPSWTFADDFQVRQRLDKGRRNGAWRMVNVEDGARSKVVTRARGKTWCYQTKAFMGEQQVTRWSKQRCVTVRR